jgi:N-acetyltransferase 10
MQGDMIPWTVSQQYQDSEFASLSGARVVRIAVHPEMGRAGYGTRTIELLRRYYEGQLADLVRALAGMIGLPLHAPL